MLVMVIGAIFLVSGMSSTVLPPSDGSSTKSTYSEALDMANEVSEVAQERDLIYSPTSGKSVTVYDGITVPDNTTALDLSGRGLSGSLKAEIRYLANLKELNLSQNNFTGLPAEIGQLSRLEVLNLSDNPFTGLPYEIGNLANLKTLDLRSTSYSVYDLEVIKKNLNADVKILTD